MLVIEDRRGHCKPRILGRNQYERPPGVLTGVAAGCPATPARSAPPVLTAVMPSVEDYPQVNWLRTVDQRACGPKHACERLSKPAALPCL
jgi:hypothetical protein